MPTTVASAKGLRSYQEDRATVINSEWGDLLCVFDGHSGKQTADWLAVNLPSILIEELTLAGGEFQGFKSALERAFKRADNATGNNPSGSTASVVFIPRDMQNAYIAVMGDSPVIASLKSETSSSNPADHWHVSPEHNVRTNLVERAAAEERGGIYSGGYIYRGFRGPGLQMARAFGDSGLGEIVSKEPEVYSIPLGDWLLLCSDGVTDPGHSDMTDAVGKIVALVEAGADADALVKRAIMIPTGDNATAIVWRR
jgi:serine/threonine protein phosphatase PrpC